MAIAEKNNNPAAKGEAPTEHAVCPECRLDMTAEKGWKTCAVVHCVGSKDGWSFAGVFKEARGTLHHGRRAWRCPNPECGAGLGCDVCCGHNAESILCLKCETFASGDVIMGSGRKPFVVNTRSRPEAPAVGIELGLPLGDR